MYSTVKNTLTIYFFQRLVTGIIIVSPFVHGEQISIIDYGYGSSQVEQSYPGLCPQLNNPWNGYVQGVCGPAANPGSVCVFRCYRGFQAQGSRALTCLDGGYWDNQPPVCVPGDTPVNPPIQVTCPPLSNPMNGYLSGTCSPGFPGYSCTVTCNVPYRLVGGPSVSCGSNGLWVGTMPYCQAPTGFIYFPNRGKK